MLYLPWLGTMLAGLCTGLGGLLAALLRPGARSMALGAGFAAGVMLTVSLADLLPEVLAFYSGLHTPWVGGCAVAALVGLGMLAAALLGQLLPQEEALAARWAGQNADRVAALRTALMVSAVMVAHNLPEGMLTLFAGLAAPQWGLRTALAVALHNIPEGLAVAVPFAYATGSRAKGAVAALLSGLAEPLGALLAFGLLRHWLQPGLLHGVVAFTAGVMLWAALAQLCPEALCSRHRRAGTAGLAAGCLAMVLGIAVLG